MNYRQLEAFQAVFRAGSFTLAGKLLFVSQPAVSRLILELEQEIGFKLFERHKNGLQPTPEGQLLFDEVERSFIGLRELDKTAESIRMLRQGNLRIIAMPGVAHLMLPKVLQRFWEHYPQINVEVESHPRTVVLDWIHTRQYDIGLANLPIDRREIEIVKIFEVRMACVMPSTHRLAARKRVHLRDLHGEDLIAFPIGSYVRHEVEKLLKQHQVECRIKLSTRSTGDIYQFVKHGAGISLIFPFDQFGESVMPELTFCELEEEYSMKIAIFRSHFRKSSLAAEQLLDLMTKMIGQALPSTRG